MTGNKKIDELIASILSVDTDQGTNSVEKTRELQKLIGVSPDGEFGPKSLEKLQKFVTKAGAAIAPAVATLASTPATGNENYRKDADLERRLTTAISNMDESKLVKFAPLFTEIDSATTPELRR